MSDYGLYVKNPSGDVQIDGAYRNYVLLDATTVDIGGWKTATANNGDQLSYQEPVFVAMKPDSTYYGQVAVVETSGVSTYTIICFSGNPGAGTADIIFGCQAPGINKEQYGMKIWDASGDLVLTSADNPLIFVNTYNVTLNNNATVVNQTVEDTSNYFLLTPMNMHAVTTWVDPDWLATIYTTGFKKTSATNIAMVRYPYIAKTVAGNYDEDIWTTSCMLLEMKLAVTA